jgi:hypothetical protein
MCTIYSCQLYDLKWFVTINAYIYIKVFLSVERKVSNSYMRQLHSYSINLCQEKSSRIKLQTTHHLLTGRPCFKKLSFDIRFLSLFREFWNVSLKNKKTNKLHGLSPQANYTDRATAACRRSDCQLLRIKGATWSAWRIPTAVFSVF